MDAGEVHGCCNGETRADLHHIAADAFGVPGVFCVGRQAFDVVHYAGRTGELKHWGSPFACNAPGGAALVKADIPGLGNSVVAAFVYGSPLPAEEAMSRSWCGRCRSAALKLIDWDLAGGDDGLKGVGTENQTGALGNVVRLIEDAVG